MHKKQKIIYILFAAVLFSCFPLVRAEAKTKIRLSKTKLELYEASKAKVRMKGKQNVKWHSSNKRIVRVSSTGVILAKKSGNAKVIASVSKKKKKFRAVCKVKVGKYVNSIRLKTATSVILEKGKTSRISVDVLPSKSLKKAVTYKSLNTQVVTVSSSGILRANAKGLALIKITSIGITKKKKRVSAFVTVFVTENNINKGNNIMISSPEPQAPSASATVEDVIFPSATPIPTTAVTSLPTVEPLPSVTAVPEVSSSPDVTTSPVNTTQPPQTLQEVIDSIPLVDNQTLLAATILAKESEQDKYTLYFINKNYEGLLQMELNEKIFSASVTSTEALVHLDTDYGSIKRNNVRLKRERGQEWWSIQDLEKNIDYQIKAYPDDVKYYNQNGYGLIIAKGDTRNVFRIS